MKAYQVSKQAEGTLKEKLEAVKGYEAEDLLYVIREFESEPQNFEPEIIEAVSTRLYEKGIVLFY